MKKDKEVITVATPRDGDGVGELSDKSDDPSLRPFRFSARNASSKYDFVKVKVWLGDNADHYYVLSRFLLSRMLTVTKARAFASLLASRGLGTPSPQRDLRLLKLRAEQHSFMIPNHVAIKIALELKKLLIDNSLLDVSQTDLEANLFKVSRILFAHVWYSICYELMIYHTELMERRGYGVEYINRYKLMTRFHHQRVPLVILVCGTACTGKSTIATQLAQRLNLPNVLQVNTATAPLTSTPVWAREFGSSEEFITEFCRECRIVRKENHFFSSASPSSFAMNVIVSCLAGDLKKAMKDGKPIIIEGIHLDPSIYLMDDESKAPTNQQPKVEESKVSSDSSPGNSSSCVDDQKLGSESRSPGPENSSAKEVLSSDQMHKVLCSVASVNIENKAPAEKGEICEEQKTDTNPPAKKERLGPEPIIVPIVLKMAEFDHEDKDRLIKNLKTIQDYLCSFESQGLTVVNISATTFPQTLEWLHGHLLQCIEQGISSTASPKKQTKD
ncbi:hypothetical protein KSS87_020141 [Heliosperma pusillum]|nr:hypothetical protein KSS87_020141 [Heliosperma pusillum]